MEGAHRRAASPMPVTICRWNKKKRQSTAPFPLHILRGEQRYPNRRLDYFLTRFPLLLSLYLLVNYAMALVTISNAGTNLLARHKQPCLYIISLDPSSQFIPRSTGCVRYIPTCAYAHICRMMSAKMKAHYTRRYRIPTPPALALRISPARNRVE